MSAGLLLLHACVTNGDAAAMRAVPGQFFNDAEQPLYTAIMAHTLQHGRVPGMEAMVRMQPRLSAAGQQVLTTFLTLDTTETVPYYVEHLRTRHAYNAVKGLWDGLTVAQDQRNMPQVERILQEMLTGVRHGIRANTSVTLHHQARNVMIESRAARLHSGLLGASLCWPSLDAATNGMSGGEVAFIVGRPGQGKSWAAMCVAQANHLLGKKVLFVSMEMGLNQIARRWLGLMTGVNPNVIRSGHTDLEETAALMSQIESLEGEAPVHLVSGDLSKDVAGVETLIEEHQPDFVVIDALYLMSRSGLQNGYIEQWKEITAVVREVKSLALRKNLPILGTVQFNRNQGGAKSKKVMDLVDIGGADAIGMDASIVIGMQQWDAPYAETRRRMQVIKNREGDMPTFGIGFEFEPVRFPELPPEDEDAESEELSQRWGAAA